MKRAFGDKASIASVADVLRWDAYLIDVVAAPAAVRAQEPSADAGEWALRRRIAEAVERILNLAQDAHKDDSAGGMIPCELVLRASVGENKRL